MVTGASTADLAVLLVDARKGVLTQTRRHSYLAKLVGIRRFVLAVNKMDLVDYDQAAFDAISADYRDFADQIGIDDWVAIPVSGLNGDNVMSRSEATPWYSGPSLLEHLDTVPLDVDADAGKPLRMPVQWVNRPNQNFRGFSGQIASGTMGPGAEVRILPSGRIDADRARSSTLDGDLDEAVAGQSVTVTFEDEIDCSRGDVIAAAGDPPEAADQFEATIVWMADEELLPGRGYWMKLGTQTVTATVQQPKYEINVNTLEHLAATTLGLNAIGVAEIATDREIVFEPYAVEGTSPNKALGGFILIDKLTNATVACGMLHFALRRALNIHRQHLDVSRETHAAHQRPEAGGAVVHRPFRRGQVDHRQPRRKEAGGARPAHLPARRRQYPPRAQPRPWLHRSRPHREHPPRRRSRAADGRRRPDRPDRLHLAVPRRARTWCGG